MVAFDSSIRVIKNKIVLYISIALTETHLYSVEISFKLANDFQGLLSNTENECKSMMQLMKFIGVCGGSDG